MYTVNSSLFPFVSFTQAASDASLIIVILTSPNLGLIIIYPTSPCNLQLLLPSFMHLQPHSVTLYPEWLMAEQ